MKVFYLLSFVCLSLLSANARIASAQAVIGGTAGISLTNSPTNATFADRFFVGTDASSLTLTQLLDTVGNPAAPYVRDPNFVTMSINGSSVSQPTGRSRQSTNLNFTPAGNNIAAFLTSWTAATAGFGAFGPNLTGGEQVGIDGVLRFDTVLGVGLAGDFALSYNPLASVGEGLTLTQNVSANAIVWELDIVDATFTSSASGFSFEADMFTTPGPGGFYGIDTNAGKFTISAITAVPEPNSIGLIALATGLPTFARRRNA